jgi:drug/metabolite transporter (DMT)-like permease
VTGLAVTLVLLSALGHSTWNLLARRATNPEVFTWWMAAAATVLWVPAAIFYLTVEAPDTTGWAFLAGTIVLHTGYYTFLSRAYRDGDLSIVYPVARGTGLALIPAWAIIFLDERVSWPAGLGIGLIVIGLGAVAAGDLVVGSRPFSLRRIARDPGVGYALLTGLIISGYSVLDKQGVQHVAPLLYVYIQTAVSGLAMLAFISRLYSRDAFKQELRRHARSIAVAGILQTGAYGLVLIALTLPGVPVSYVGPFREVGVVIGVALGALVLKERVTRRRMSGAALIAAGAVAIALAP